VAQSPGQEPPEDIASLIRNGLAETLEAKLHGGRTPDEARWLAQAYANQGRRAAAAQERQRAFDQARRKYQAWIQALEKAAKPGDRPGAVRLAAARTEYGNMLLSGPAASGINEYEITAGQRGDPQAIGHDLSAAREQYQKAIDELATLWDDLSTYEEELLAAGLYETLLQARLDATLNLGWSLYYLAVLERQDPGRRAELLAAAQRRFQELLDSGRAAGMQPHCRLGLAMTQRERGQLPEAEKTLASLLEESGDRLLTAQARYELARCQIQAEKFDEARASLRPLADKDPENLAPEDRPARFYVNLAQLWEANCYLMEANELCRQARNSVSRTALLQKAQRARQTGLAKFRRLARRGGPWPALAQIFIAQSVDSQTPFKELSVTELLYTASALMDSRQYQEALQRLQEADSRPEPDRDLAGQVLFELARCQYLLNDERAAAQNFTRLATQYRDHAQAPQAASLACQLWSKLAETSQRTEDYLQLAHTLRNLIENFADHPQREEAVWLLPVALQRAGRFLEAADEFGKVPDSSIHAEEARYRRVLCARQALESARQSLEPDEYRRRAVAAAEALVQYADQADSQPKVAAAGQERGSWSAEARIAAAELLASPGVADYQQALAVLDSFETRYPALTAPGSGQEQYARVLAARIRAHHGLRQFDQAADILAQFLKNAPSDQAGATLVALAKGMLEEAERLAGEGQVQAARQLALNSLDTFEKLETWTRTDPRRAAAAAEAVLGARARMLYLAGQYDQAQQMVTDLLQKAPKDGNLQHLRALVLTARLTDSPSAEDLKAAQDAWGLLLSDPAIRQRAPERYWEARYNWLALALRAGKAAEVHTAIVQERIWRPDMGGPAWRPKFEELLQAAGQTLELTPAATNPADPISKTAGTGRR